MELSKFNEKFNKVEGNIYTVEEEITLVDGVYIGTLAHDNVNKDSINIYTGPMLTGDKITNKFLSTPSETPWKYVIKIIAPNINKVFVTYETVGDQVESEDINNLQNELVRTQQEVNIKANKDTVFTKEEVLQKISDLVNSAPSTLDTLNEIANALGNDPNFSATILNLLGNKVDKIEGKKLSTEDYSPLEKTKLAGIQENANNYIHPDKHPASMITEDDNHMFVTKEEKGAINTSGSDPIFETAGGTGTAITLTLPPLTNGLSKNFIASADNGGNSTTINEKKVFKPVTTTAPTFKAGRGYTVWYNPSGDNGNGCFFCKASAVGTALAKDVRKGKDFSNDNDIGIPGGLDLSLLISGNIRAGVTIDGITGKSSVVDTADATATAGDIISGKSAYVNSNKVDGSIINRSSENWHQPALNACVSSANGYGVYVMPPAGYYNGSSWVRSLQPDLVSGNILGGKNICGIAGGIPLLNPSWGDQKEITNISVGAYSYNNGANYAYFQVPNGNYLNGINWISHYEPYLFAQNIALGATICGIVGSHTSTLRTGTIPQGGVVNVGFRPKMIVMWYATGSSWNDYGNVYVIVDGVITLEANIQGGIRYVNFTNYAAITDVGFNYTGSGSRNYTNYALC